MDTTRFDRIATLFAERRLNRRRAVQHAAAGLAAMALATGVRTTGARSLPRAAALWAATGALSRAKEPPVRHRP